MNEIKNSQPQRIDRQNFGARVAAIRERSGLTKKDFAASIGVAQGNYIQVERGERLLTIDQIYTAYLKYGIPMEYFLLGLEANLPERFRG